MNRTAPFCTRLNKNSSRNAKFLPRDMICTFILVWTKCLHGMHGCLNKISLRSYESHSPIYTRLNKMSTRNAWLSEQNFFRVLWIALLSSILVWIKCLHGMHGCLNEISSRSYESYSPLLYSSEQHFFTNAWLSEQNLFTEVWIALLPSILVCTKLLHGMCGCKRSMLLEHIHIKHKYPFFMLTDW